MAKVNRGDAAAKVEEAGQNARMLRVPVGEATGYFGRHVELQLNGEQAVALARLQAGLEENRCRLKNNKLVATRMDAVRWLLEQIA